MNLLEREIRGSLLRLQRYDVEAEDEGPTSGAEWALATAPGGAAAAAASADSPASASAAVAAAVAAAAAAKEGETVPLHGSEYTSVRLRMCCLYEGQSTGNDRCLSAASLDP